MPDNSYNAVLYHTYPRRQTHPDCLAAVATLFGMNPAPVNRCRVFELGCGDGANLIPMAYGLPESHFVGMDLADGPIAKGRRAIKELGLKNITLLCGDVCDEEAVYGEFDYVVAHGLYSWVPENVRERLMAVAAESLAPQGVAMISYNVLPGCYPQKAVREMLLHYAGHIADPQQRLQEVERMLRFLKQEQARFPGPGKAWLGDEIETTQKRSKDVLFHDTLEKTNDAFYLSQFVEHARSYRLQYLGDAAAHLMFDPLGIVDGLGEDVVEREQYLDFLRARRFRHTMLCWDDVKIDHQVVPGQMDSFLFSANTQELADGQLEGLHKIRITSASEATYRVALAMGEVYPLPVTFEELVPYAGSPEALREILLGLLTAGFADIHVFDFPCQESVTEKPAANLVARYQASSSRLVTNACHHTVEMDEIGRFLLTILDGTRDLEQLARDLATVPGAPRLEEIRDRLPASLEGLAGKALLEA